MFALQHNATGIQIRSMLVATDFSKPSEKALRHAVGIARFCHSKLYLAHVVSSIGFSIAGPESQRLAFESAERDLQSVVRRLISSRAIAAADLRAIVCEGEIWEELEAVLSQQTIDMVVVGTNSRKGLSKLILRSQAQKIFRAALCPVVIVGPGCPSGPNLDSSELRPFLFPADFSDESLRALPYAIGLANERQTRLVLLNTVSDVPKIQACRWYTAKDVFEIRRAIRTEVVERLRRLLSKHALAIQPICVAEFGEAAETIVWVAKNLGAEAVIIGLKGNPFHNSHRCSTAYDVASLAACPVITVRG